VKEFLSFGLYQMGEKAINYFTKEFDTILIGKLLGIEVLGIYNVSKNLVNKPSKIINPIITKVTFPVMSKINHDLAKLKSVFLKTINYLSYINFPVYFLIALLAEPLIILMFGNEWLEAIPIVQVLAFVFLLRSIGNPSGSLLLSRGRADVAFYWGLCKFILYPVFILIGSQFDIFGITVSLLALNIIIYFLNWRIIVLKTCNAGFTEYFKAIKKPLLFTLFPALLILLISFFNLDIFIFASISLILFSILYLIIFIKFDTKSFHDFKSMIFKNN
jgi:O-antigen/teichoic acid export membrane protein